MNNQFESYEKMAREIVDSSFDDIEYYESKNLVWKITQALSKVAKEKDEEIKQAIQSERERCAKVAENWRSQDNIFEFKGKMTCGSDAHDPRWCSHCESKNDGAGAVAEAIRKGGE